MNFWLVKTEPHTFSWEDQKKSGVESWNGVRNYQARNNLRNMKKGDLVLFYHSGKDKAVVGVVVVKKEAYDDPEDTKFSCVDVKTFMELKNPVSLDRIKSNPNLVNMVLIKHSRLSVMPLLKEEYLEIIKMSKD